METVMALPGTLAGLECLIEQGLRTFVEVGMALSRIRDERMYKDGGYSDFDSYCRERWKFSRQRAHQMIEAAAITFELSTRVDIPAPQNEKQVRELARVEPERRAETWQAVIEEHGPEPTAKEVREVVRDRFPDLVPSRVLTPAQTEPLFVPGPDRVPIDIEPAEPDADDAVERFLDTDDMRFARLRVQYSREIKHLEWLIQLKPESVAACLEADELPNLRMKIARTRKWLDEIEEAITPRGLRAVK